MGSRSERTADRSLEQARDLVGVRGPVIAAADPVNLAMVRQWCDAIGDRNPAYLDDERAGRTVHGGLIAPAAMMQVWTMPGFGRPRIDDPVTDVWDLLVRAGYPSIVAVNCEQEYLEPLRPGDHVSMTRWIETISSEKRTAIGPGVFVSSVSEVTDSSGTVVGRQRYRVLNFCPDPQPRPTPRSRSDRDDATAVGSPGVVRSMTGTVAVGDELPTLRIPLTRTLIVAAAIATHDWEPIHHDPAAARASGLDDVFTNILSTNGFVGRLVTDWAGPDAALTAIRIRLGAPNYPGDTLALAGTVMAVAPGRHGCEVDIDVRGRNGVGDHVTGSVAVHLPAREEQP